MRIIIACCLALLLGGCLTPEERQARLQAQMATADAADADRCGAYGAQPGSPAYTDCRLRLTQMRQQAEIAGQAQRTAILGQVIQNNQAIQAQQQAQQQQNLRAVVQPVPQTTQTNCTTSYASNQAYTHCQ